MDKTAKYMRFSKRELSGSGTVPHSVPYGYKNDGGLLPHPRTAPVVREIYEQYTAGETFCAIARGLSDKGLPTPSMEKGKKSAASRWSAATVRAILLNPVYGKGAVPLVAPPVFEDAAGLLERSALRRRQAREHLLSGMVFCGDCGAALSLKQKSGGRRQFVCSAWRKKQSDGICSPHTIREDTVIRAVLMELYVLAKNIDTEALMALYKEKECSRLVSMLKSRVEDSQGALVELYKDKCRGLVGEEEYRLLSGGLKKEIEFCESQMESTPELFDARLYYTEVKRILNDILNFEKIHKSILQMLVRRIRVFDDGRILIEFNFTEP